MNFDNNDQNYIDWKVTSVTRIKEKYGYRIILKYSDGTEKVQQKSGFATEKKAQADRDKTIASLYNGSYIVYGNVRVSDFMEYWLNNDLDGRTESNNTMFNYRGIIRNHINPTIGKKKMAELTRTDIQKLYNDVAARYRSTAEQIKTIINVAMRYAVSKKIIAYNPAEGVQLPKNKPKVDAGFRERIIDTKKTLNLDQIVIRRIISSRFHQSVWA